MVGPTLTSGELRSHSLPAASVWHRAMQSTLSSPCFWVTLCKELIHYRSPQFEYVS